MGTDSQNCVDFVGEVEGKVLGTGEPYYVLPSHPTRVRGLKRITLSPEDAQRVIASHAGARIETSDHA